MAAYVSAVVGVRDSDGRRCDAALETSGGFLPVWLQLGDGLDFEATRNGTAVYVTVAVSAAAVVTFAAVKAALAAADDDIDVNGEKITGLGTPMANTDAATKAYADASVTWARIVTAAAGANSTIDFNDESFTGVGNVTCGDISAQGVTAAVAVVAPTFADPTIASGTPGGAVWGGVIWDMYGALSGAPTTANKRFFLWNDGTITVGHATDTTAIALTAATTITATAPYGIKETVGSPSISAAVPVYTLGGAASTAAGLAVSTTANAGGLVRITTTTNHGLSTGARVLVHGVGGTTEANGFWPITVTAVNQFTLDGSAFVNPHTVGGTVDMAAAILAFPAPDDDSTMLDLTLKARTTTNMLAVKALVRQTVTGGVPDALAADAIGTPWDVLSLVAGSVTDILWVEWSDDAGVLYVIGFGSIDPLTWSAIATVV